MLTLLWLPLPGEPLLPELLAVGVQSTVNEAPGWDFSQ